MTKVSSIPIPEKLNEKIKSKGIQKLEHMNTLSCPNNKSMLILIM